VAKWLRQRFVVPPFTGSIPVVRPKKFYIIINNNLDKGIFMSRYTGPKLRITRRLGNLPALTNKISIRLGRPGQHGKNKIKLKDYTIRLQEKQKLKFNYGLTESQLYRYVKQARRQSGITGLILLQLLEMRLDSICFSLNVANTISSARQIINHGHILINNNKVNIPSFRCKPGDIISINSKVKSKVFLNQYLENNEIPNLPSHLDFNNEKCEGTINNYCSREDINFDLNELLVIEYYSRR
jgi:small subunit ribosomal protein S4